MSVEMIVLDSVDSTNTYAKKELAHRDRFVVLAAHQSAGRGRMGRSFLGEGGIYMSYATRTSLPLSSAVSVTVACAAFVCRALEKYSGKRLGIKWVNDIMLDGKKVCGILAEALTVGNDCGIVVGIGINAGRTHLPDELSDIAGIIEIDDNDREALIADIISDLEHFLESPTDTSHMQYYRDRLTLTGKRVRAFSPDGEVCGTVEGVDDDGALLLVTNTSHKPIRIFSGEVSVRDI